jgi:5-methylcytosine-specific restriction protein A
MKGLAMKRTTGKSLCREYGIDAAHSLYRKTGDWYHVLRSFPGALLDADGFIPFPDERIYAQFTSDEADIGVREKRSTNTLTVRNGISRHPRYRRYKTN